MSKKTINQVTHIHMVELDEKGEFYEANVTAINKEVFIDISWHHNDPERYSVNDIKQIIGLLRSAIKDADEMPEIDSKYPHLR